MFKKDPWPWTPAPYPLIFSVQLPCIGNYNRLELSVGLSGSYSICCCPGGVSVDAAGLHTLDHDGYHHIITRLD